MVVERAGSLAQHARRPTAATSRAYRALAAQRGTSTLHDGDHADLVDFVGERRTSTARRRRSVARQLAAIRMLHRYLADRAAAARRPDRAARRRPGAVGDPQTAHRGTGRRACSTPSSATSRSTGATARCSSCSTPPGARISEVGRAVGRATSTSTSRWCACSARVPRSGSCRSARRPRSALDEWFSPSGRARLVPAAVAAARRRRGGVPQPTRWPAQPPGRVAGDQEVRRARRHHATTCRRTCCATRARPTCSTTAPTCGSCRRCSATPRSRPPRCTPRSARSACGRSTGQRTRGRTTG